MENLVVSAENWIIGHIIHYDQDTVEFLMVLLLLVFYHLTLRVDNMLQGFWIIMIEKMGSSFVCCTFISFSI